MVAARLGPAQEPDPFDKDLVMPRLELAEAFCGVWQWAEAHLARIETARAAFDATRARVSEGGRST